MPISLFYWYTDIKHVDELIDRVRKEGERLQLGGRIRVSPEGINATIGGSEEAVDTFHSFIRREMDDADIDFKISDGGAEHFEFNLQVRNVREVVTLGEHARQATWREAAPHITPEQFRNELLSRNNKQDENGTAKSNSLFSAGSHDEKAELNQGNGPDIVVLDARNSYETAIGRFDGAIVPDTRQFAQFSSFVKRKRDLFKDKRVLMYCTGGVRCERGSAVVSLETEAKSIVQLQGGIDAFLKQFPDGGGVFKGRNLVFDKRITQSFNKESQSLKEEKPAGGITLGECVCCGRPWDDYSAEWRCRHCRSRVLVCTRRECEQKWNGSLEHTEETGTGTDGIQNSPHPLQQLCEKCMRGNATGLKGTTRRKSKRSRRRH